MAYVNNKCIQISKFDIIFMSIYVYRPSVSAQVQISSVTHCGVACPGLTLLGKLSKEWLKKTSCSVLYQEPYFGY